MGKHERRVSEAREGRQAEGVTPVPPVVTPRALAKLVVLGAMSALWSLVLWQELVLVRAGGSSFCGFGGKFDCSAVWDGAFASAVHRLTGLPIAGWGLVWSVVAFLLPLAALLRRAEGKSIDPLVSGVRLTAVAGVLTVAVMLAASAVAGAVCVGCIATYVLVGAYAFIALLIWRPAGFPSARRGATVAAGVAAAAFLVLLYPGLRTPKTRGEAGRRAVAEAVRSMPGGQVTPSARDSQRDQRLTELVGSLEPPLRQTLADSLAIYRASPTRMPPPPRALVGSDLAPVRITEFTDILCEHCADLHKTLDALRDNTPPGSFSVDARQFPLDGECNPFVRRASDPVRCLAARVKICLEGRPKASEVAGLLFENQQGLTPDKVFALTAPYSSRRDLEACVTGAETAAKLAEDIRVAAQYDPDGTPIVVVNGRQGTSFGPFLYAMVLARGDEAQPAFDSLPPPNPKAHLH